MVKLVYCLRRRADVSPEEFYRYWLDTHGPKVKNAAEAMRALRYIQSHTCGPELNQAFAASRGLAPAYDGITEVWWNSIEDLKSAMASAGRSRGHGDVAGRRISVHRILSIVRVHDHRAP